MHKESGNAAYDLSRYETKPAERQQQPEQPEIKAVPGRAHVARRRFARLQLACAVALTALITGLWIQSQVSLTEISAQISRANKELTTQENIAANLEMQIEAKMSLVSIEEYAKDKLGLGAPQKSQTEYVTVYEGTQVEKPDNSAGKSFFQQIKEWIEKIKEYLNG